MTVKGIPPSLYRMVRNVLVDCSSLTYTDLHALFTNDDDDHLALWKNHLPSFEGLDPLTRAEILIDFLVNQANQADENGLVLFLHALRDDTDVTEREACYERLHTVAKHVEAALREQERKELHDVEKTKLYEKSIFLADVKVTLRQKKDGWALQAQNIGQWSLKKLTIFLHPGRSLWVNKHKLSLGTLPPAALSAAIPLAISVKQPQSNIDKEAYQLSIEVLYLPQLGGHPIRLQESLEILE